jgi:phosphocarrier protein
MGDEVLVKDVKVENKYGLHARPAALIAQVAGKYDCEIFIEKDGNKVSCKSIIGLMTIEGYPGSVMRLSTSGEGAEEAMSELVELFVNKFNED